MISFLAGGCAAAAGRRMVEPAVGPTITIGSPSRYSGVTRNSSRVMFSAIAPDENCNADHATATLRVPTPKNPPKSITAARTSPECPTRISVTGPSFSPEALVTTFPSKLSTLLSSTTTAGVPSDEGSPFLLFS